MTACGALTIFMTLLVMTFACHLLAPEGRGGFSGHKILDSFTRILQTLYVL